MYMSKIANIKHARNSSHIDINIVIQACKVVGKKFSSVHLPYPDWKACNIGQPFLRRQVKKILAF